MIKKLMNQEYPYGEPEYSKITAQIVELRQKLREQLPPEGQNLLEQLNDAITRRENVLADAIFTEGFCTAMDLIAETYNHNRQ